MTAKTAPARQDPSAIATFVLLAGQQRGESTIPTLAIKPETTTLRLQLTTEEGLDEGAYTASLTNSRGERILGASRLHPRVEAGRGYIDLRVQAALLIPGGYAIDLTPEPVSNSSPVLSYRFTLARIPSISAPSQ